MLVDTISNTHVKFADTMYKLRDLWLKKDVGTTKKDLKQDILAHDVLMLKLSRQN